MSPRAASTGGATVLRLLAADALRDALRRRMIWVVGGITVLGVLALRSCGGDTTFVMNGQELDAAPYLAPGAFVCLAAGVVTLAGLLAADHLARPLEEGSVPLWLARPVSRSGYALARLAGALGIAGVAAAALLGTATGLAAGSGLPVAPALLASLACAVDLVIVGAFAMALSLVLPRILTALVVIVAVGWFLWVNALALFGVQYESALLVLTQEVGPPLFTAVGLAVFDWIPGVERPPGGTGAALRLGGWAAVAVGALLVGFHRREI